MIAVPGGVRAGMTTTNIPTSSQNARPAVATNARSVAAEIAWYAAALALIAALGSLKLATPLHRDTATFLWMASQMDRGAVLYADVWDLKQPGIFLFNYAAGRLFGFTAEGVRLFELVWQLAFAGIVIIALRPLLRYRWLAAVAPAAFLGSYYVFCEPHQQGQLEILVGLPLFVVAWLLAIDWRNANSRVCGFLAAGVAAGIATGFKHVLAPIPVVFLLAATVITACHGTQRRSPGAILLQSWLPFAFGVILVWGLTAAAFWWLGAFDAFFTTTFLYPLHALEEVQAAPFGRLALAVAIFAAALAPWLLYAAIAAVRGGDAEEPPLFRLMLFWLGAAAFVILLQKSSWWTYHMLLLYPPVGILAARGVDLAVSRLCRPAGPATAAGRRAAPLLLSALLVLPVLAAYAYPAGETARPLLSALSADNGSLDAYRRQTSVYYAGAADAAAFLTASAPPGPVYVFGDPTILLLSGRSQAIPPQGSAWDFYLPELWRTLPAELQKSRPVWIFVEAASADSIARRSPQTMALLARDYRIVWNTPYGQWYARRDLAADPLP